MNEAFKVHGGTEHRNIEGAGGGANTVDVCRNHGISDAAFYKYKAKNGGMDVSDARKLKAPEDDNAKLKKLFAGAMLDNAIPKDVA
jgi:putative transposase